MTLNDHTEYALAREQVPATPRKAMTPARRKRIWLRDNGCCGACGVSVPLKGTVVDHRLALHHGGADDDANCRFMCKACDKPKTADDQSISGHIRRLIKKADPEYRNRPRRRIAGRKLSDSNLRKLMNGRVVRRTKEQTT